MSSYRDAIEHLETVVALVKKADTLSNLLARVRMVDERDTDTLERLIRERSLMVEILRCNNFPFQDFDFEYKEDLETKLQVILVNFKRRGEKETAKKTPKALREG